jgi:hypothetical protein
MNIKDILTSRGSIGRKTYLLWGMLLFALKYNLDRLIALDYGKEWYFTDYYVQADTLSTTTIYGEERSFYWSLLLTSLPFIWFGTVLCIKRLRNAELPPWLVIFFFIPFINLLLFFILSAIPTKKEIGENITSRPFLDRLIPASRYGSAAFAIGIVTFFSLLLTLLFVNILGEYGWSLFVGVPFLLGFASVLLYGYHNPISYKQSVQVSLISVVLFSLMLFILALEGAICLIMGFPILLILAWIGGTIGFSIQERRRKNVLNITIVPLLFIPLMGIWENLENQPPPIIAVETAVLVAADRQQVWDELLAFSPIEEPNEWIFKSGIAYPTHAEINGRGVGAIRNCTFTTGSFIEPITVWNEPTLLQFSVLDQPPPMAEWSFYEKLEITHLDGYFKSVKGQFKLTKQPDGSTLLEGTTWYQHEISPSFYWRFWSDYVLHKIHLRVLSHIKHKSEQTQLTR